MFLHIPGMHPREKSQFQDLILARKFWTSPWGLTAAADGIERPTEDVIAFLTASAALGGMEASWDSCCGLPRLIQVITETRPEGAPPCASQP